MANEVYEPAFFDSAIDFSVLASEAPEATSQLRRIMPVFPTAILKKAAGLALSGVLVLVAPSADSQVIVRRAAIPQTMGMGLGDLGRAADAVLPLFNELEKLRDLQENWDSYGAPTPNAVVIDTARAFLTELLSAANARGRALETPSVQVSGAGTAGFAWGDPAKNWSLEVEAHPDRVLTFVWSEGDEIDVGTVESASQILEKLPA